MYFSIENLLVVLPEDVGESHFFLQELVNPYVIWGIRGFCIIAGIGALIIYFIMKKKKGE